jgi:6-phosphofructokinase
VVELDLEHVSDIHHHGGTILQSSRGGFDIEVIINFLRRRRINQLYVIGGDGTHRGAYIISQEVIKRHMNVAVVGIPKTIDNDVGLIDRSFGFTTSVEAAQAAILSAKIEAKCNLPNGIGIVKLMGRSAGFIAVHAVLASGDVDLCLVPEIEIELDGPNGCLPFLMRRVADQGHAVVVVAEGAGEELLGQSAETDASGNKKLPAIGVSTQGQDHFQMLCLFVGVFILFLRVLILVVCTHTCHYFSPLSYYLYLFPSPGVYEVKNRRVFQEARQGGDCQVHRSFVYDPLSARQLLRRHLLHDARA